LPGDGMLQLQPSQYFTKRINSNFKHEEQPAFYLKTEVFYHNMTEKRTGDLIG